MKCPECDEQGKPSEMYNDIQIYTCKNKHRYGFIKGTQEARIELEEVA